MTAPVLDPLIGRDEELATIRDRLADHRIVTLVAPGGAGKTRLARAIADQTPGAAFVDATAVVEAAGLPSAILATLGLTETAEQDATDAIAAWARGEGRLLVLDNLEQIAGASAPLTRILEACNDLRMLATSRVPLGVRGEADVAIPPLSTPRADDASSVEESSAGALFLRRARELGQLHWLDSDAARAVADLCRRLDGFPLAIELAAARTRVLEIGEIVDRLSGNDAKLLTSRLGDERHRSLAAVLDWSLSLLTASDRGFLAALADATSQFDVPLAEAIAPDADVLDALDNLVSLGLVVAEGERRGRARFRILETVRAAAMGGDPTPRRRHAEELLRRVSMLTADVEGPDGADRLAELDAEAPNLLTALAWAEADDPNLALALAASAYPYWAVRGFLRDGLDRLMNALEAAGPEAPFRARAFAGISRLTSQLGTHKRALASGREAARLGRETGDAEAEIEGLQSVAWALFEPDATVDENERAAARSRAVELLATASVGQRFRIRQTLLALALVEHGIESAEVMVLMDAAIDEAAESNNAIGLAKLRGNRSINHMARGEFAETTVDAMAAADDFRELGDTYHECWSLNNVVVGMAGEGRRAELPGVIGRIRELTAALEAEFEVVGILSSLSASAAALGEARVAARLWGRAQAIEPDLTSIPATDWIRDRARKVIGEVAWSVALADGASRDNDELIDEFVASLETAARAREQPPPLTLRHGTLTKREVEILRLVADGRSNAEIGEALFISAKTASVHVNNVKAKLGVETRLEAALAARRLGLAERE